MYPGSYCVMLSLVSFFRGMHPGSRGDGVGNHPNSYHVESVKYWKSRSTTGTDKSKLEEKVTAKSEDTAKLEETAKENVTANS